MAKIVAGLASSHAFAFLDPSEWDTQRERNRQVYKRYYGVEPPEQRRIAEESLELIRPRYARVEAALDRLRELLVAKQPDALLVIGDDQNENYTEENLPQFAMYTGEQVRAVSRGADGRTYPCHHELAQSLLESCVAQGFDVAWSRRFPNEELRSHAHGPPLRFLTPATTIPIVPIFINALHHPAPEPARCYAFGQAIRRALDARPAHERVAVYASGGLSHFTAGYPWKQYQGPFGYGAISEEFDRALIGWMRRGEGSRTARLTSRDLLDHGEIEYRNWIALLGALGDVPAADVTYEPFYRGIMGMGVGCWDPETAG